MIRSLAAAALLFAAVLTPQQERGRRIYRTGESASGAPIVALVGPGDVELPATVVPCASCHGRDGRGKEEGGLRPSNLQWDVLTKPYSVATPDGRKHPPYTPALVKRAITMGVDPAKNRLNPAMPRYRLSLDDAADLVAYLQRLGNDPDPGLTDDALRIGLRGDGEERSAARETVAAYFEGINRGGGVFGRRLEIAGDDEAFAVIDVGSEAQAGDGVPTIAALGGGGEESRYLFHLLAGIEEQSLALIATLPGDAAVRIVDSAATASAAARMAGDLGTRIKPEAKAVLFLGDADALKKLIASGTASTILIPAPFTTDAVFTAPPSVRILVSLPASMADETPAGAAELRGLSPPTITHRTARAAALAAAKLLTRALRRAGRDVNRELLVDTLETFRGEPTDLTPPVTWTRTRHTGTTHSTIARVDGKGGLAPLGD